MLHSWLYSLIVWTCCNQSAFIRCSSATEYFKYYSNLYSLHFNYSTVQSEQDRNYRQNVYVSVSMKCYLQTTGRLQTMYKKQMQAYKMAQWVEVLAHRSKHLGSTSWSHKVAGESCLLTSIQLCTSALTRIHNHTYNHKQNTHTYTLPELLDDSVYVDNFEASLTLTMSF